MRYLIFDFDGVLGDTKNARNNVVAKIDKIDQKKVQELTNDYFSNPSHTRNHYISPESHIKSLKWVHEFGCEMLDQDYNFFEGFIEEIRKIKNTKLAIVSSGNKVYINQIKKYGLEFTHILDYFDHHSKEEKVESICKDWSIEVKNAFYFTDTQTDVKELSQIMDKSKLIGCVWGYQGLDKLLEVLPENQILKEFSDIHFVINPDKSDLNPDSKYFENLQLWCKRDNRHAIVAGFIFNSQNKVLVQKRSPNRRLYPNFWDISFGGHTEDNETIFEALEREMFEETGLKLDTIDSLVQIFDWEVPKNSQKTGDNIFKREFDFIVTAANLDNLQMEVGKVSEQKWIDLEDLEQIYKTGNMDDYVYKLLKKVLEKIE